MHEPLGHPMPGREIAERLGITKQGNGPEFIAKAVQDWISAVGAKTAYIEPASPWESGYRESFNSKLRVEPMACR